MKQFIIAGLVTSAGFIVAGTAQAQLVPKYSVGLNLGTFIYSGDLTPSAVGSWKTPGFVWGLTGHKHFTNTLAARLELNFGKLRGDDAAYNTPEYRQYRAFAFNSRVTEIVLAAEYSLLGMTRRLSPYVFGGIGYSGMKISRDYSGFNEAYFVNEPSLKTALAEDAANTPPKGVAIFPVGLGLKYGLSSKLSLHAEAAHRITLSDYVDGFSKAVNPNKYDSYIKYSIGIRLALGNTDPYACPPIRY